MTDYQSEPRDDNGKVVSIPSNAIRISCRGVHVFYDDFEAIKKEVTRGPNKGTFRQEKRYFGEPKHTNYLKRVQDWMRGTGEYANLAPERAADPTVNLSFSSTHEVLDCELGATYAERLDFVYDLATREATPENFQISTSALRNKRTRKANWMAPFAVCTPDKWPELVRSQGLGVRHRYPLDEPSD